MAFDVAIVGAGIVGCSLAWRLARGGASVVLLERGEVGTEASWAAGGQFVAAAAPATSQPLLDHWLAAQRLYPTFAAELREETGAQFELKIGGRLSLAQDEAQRAALQTSLAAQRAGGVAAEWWEPDRVHAAEPALPETLGALHFPDHGFVDNRAMVPAIAQAAALRGAVVRTWTPVARIVVEGGQAQGVETIAGERIAAGAVVNAAGAWAGQVGGARAVPVGPSKGQMAAIELRPMPLSRIVSFPGITLVPRADGRLLLAATKESVGFDRRSTLWAVEHLLANARRALPALGDATFLGAWTGLRPRADDEVPVVGPAADVERLLYATGHFSMGILSAPATAEALTSLILEGQASLPIEAFSPGRFA
jgi:glycine oxidase